MGREPAPNQLSRLLQAHGQVLHTCHQAARQAGDAGDDGTADLLIEVIRCNEFQVWFLSQHLVPTPISEPPAAAHGLPGAKVQ